MPAVSRGSFGADYLSSRVNFPRRFTLLGDGEQAEGTRSYLAEAMPASRGARPDEIARAVLFLASSDARHAARCRETKIVVDHVSRLPAKVGESVDRKLSEVDYLRGTLALAN